MRRPVELGYLTFAVRDLARARIFFGAVFGWQFETEPVESEQGAQSAHVANTEFPFGLTEGSPGGECVVLYFRVVNIEQARTDVVTHGGEADAVRTFPSGLNAQCRDDQGTRVDLWQPAEGY